MHAIGAAALVILLALAPIPGAQAQDTPETGVPNPVGFNFKDAPFDLVIDFFSRETALPVIREAEPPNATMTFISAREYPFDEALSILNLNLRAHGLHLRREANFLYLATLKDAARKPTLTGVGDVPDDAPPDRMVTITFPLSNAIAARVAEQVKPLIGPYGAATPVEAQNMLILVESADQARRIGDVIRAIDATRPVDSEYMIFALKHAEPEAALNALKGLVGQRQKTVIIDAKGKQRVVEDLEVPGVNLQADPRTRSVIAVGPKSRLDVVEELVALIDIPAGADTDRQLRTFDVSAVEPADAKKQLDALFAGVPEDRRPTVLALADAHKVGVVAPAALQLQARALIEAMEPGAASLTGEDANAAQIIPLVHIEPDRATKLVEQLLTPQQRRAVRVASAPDGRGLVVAGSQSQVESIASLLGGLDTPPELDRDVRLVRIAKGDPESVLARAMELHAATDPQASVTATVDATTRTATLVGPRAAISKVEQLIASVAGVAGAQQTPRLYEPETRRPSELAARLRRVAPTLLADPMGEDQPTPQFEPLDDLDSLIVRATSSQHAVIERLIAQLDQEDPSKNRLRVVRLRGPEPEALLQRAQNLYDQRLAADPSLGSIDAEYDAASGSLMLTGSPQALITFNDALDQLQRLTPPARSTRLVEVRNAEAARIVEPLEALLATTESTDPARAVPEPTIRIVEGANALVVTAEDAQHRLIESFVRRLDVIEPTDLPPLKLLQLRTADANAIASMLNQQYAKRPQAERSSAPVDVRADPATNTLIVSAHASLFDEIKTFVEELNTERVDGPERVTVLFPLKVAKAVDVAAAMDRLYPEPPMPRDRRNNPMPWLQEPKEVTVSADASSNALIIDAPSDRLESLRELASKLDRVELPPVADLRTYRIVKADLQAVARTLSALARQGNLSGPAQPGKPPVQVVIETEPRSSTLIIAGDETTFERVEAVLSDLSAVPVERSLRVVPIANATADEVRERALAIYAAQIEGDPNADAVEVSVDTDSNSLMVVGDRDALARFDAILDQLQRQVGPARELRLIELRFSTPDRVIAFLEDLRDSSRTFVSGGGAEPVFEAIEETSSVLVAAQPDQLPLIEQLVRSLDSEQAAETPPLRIIRLRTTDASNIAQVLQSTYARRSADERSKKPVDIRADAATNTLIVSAHPEVLPEIESIAREMNETQTLDDDDRQIRIFPLRVARAEDLAVTIDAMYPEPPMPIDPRTRRPRPDLRQPREVVVRADRATNSLIVDAPAKRMAGFERIVESLDQETLAGEIELRTYAVERSDLGGVLTTLTNLANNNALGAASRAPISVNIDPMSRTLVVSGPPEIFDRVETVLAELESPPERPATGLKMFPLAHTRAERLQPLLERLLVARIRETDAGASRPEGEVESLLDVAIESASNTLIVLAPEEALAIASELIKALDTPAAQTGRSVVRVAPLTFAPANETARAVQAAAESMALPSGGSVAVAPAPGSNALVLTGAANDLDALAEVIESLDLRPSDAETLAVETFTLEHAEASAIAPSVERLLAQQRETDPRVLSLQLRYNRNAIEDRPTPIHVEADERTNALVVSGPAASVELARSIIDRLDRPSTRANTRTLTYTPARAQAPQLVRAVEAILNAADPASQDRVELLTDAGSGAIIVIGSDERAAEALRLLMEFDDRAPQAPEVEVAAITLANVEATAITRVLAQTLNDRSGWPVELRRAERAGVAIATPSVQADTTANRVIVSAPAALVAQARELAAALDAPTPAPSVRVFRLAEGNAESVASAVGAALNASTRPGEPRTSVSAEPASNAVLVSGSTERVAEAAALIEAMDEATSPESLGARTIILQNARAEAVAPVLERVLTRESAIQQIPVWMRGQYIARFGDDSKDDVRVSADRRLNAVIISGPPGVLDMAETLAHELDRAPDAEGLAPSRLVRVIPMTHGDAAEVAASLEQIFDEEDAEMAPPNVAVDVGANALIIRAAPEQLELVERLTSQLDRAALTSSREVRTIPIDRSKADAAVMATTLQNLLERRGGVRVEVISADELLEREATPPDPSGSIHPIDVDLTPPGGRAVDVVARLVASTAVSSIASSVRFAAQSEPPATGEAPPESPEVTIAVDPVTNAIIVIGSPRIADRVAQLTRELESQLPSEPVAVRVVDLPPGSDARAVANLVQLTARQVGRASAQNPGGFTGRVAAAADPSGDAVVVWANDTDFDALRALIGATARDRAGESLMVRVYPLESVTGAAAARAVQDLIAPAPRGRQARRLRSLNLAIEDAEGTQRVDVDPNLIRVSTDPAGASLIVVAPAETFSLIDRFVGLIDQSPVRDRLAIQRYELANASAASLANTLQRLFDAQRQGPGARDLPRARFVADARTNALLVTASGDQHEEVAKLIAVADTELEDADLPLEIIKLTQARPSAVQRVVERVIIGRDQAKRDRVRISADDAANLFLVRAPAEDLEEIRRVVREVDSADTSGLPIRVITLERADPEDVATAVRAFMDERAASTTGRRTRAPVAITAHRDSRTLIVAAADEPFEDIQRLIDAMDADEQRPDLAIRIVKLEEAEVSELQNVVESISFGIRTGFDVNWFRSRRDTNEEDRINISTDTRTNSFVLVGDIEPVERLEELIRQLDQPIGDGSALTARTVRIDQGDLESIAAAVRSVSATPNWRWWEGRDPRAVEVRVDARRRTLVLIGVEESIATAERLINQLASAEAGPERLVETIALEHARADRAARDLQRFLSQRAAAEGKPRDGSSVVGSPDGNVLIVAADAETMALVRTLAADLDRPELGEDRSIEVYTLRNGDPQQVATTLRSMFPERRAEDRVIVTPQPTGSAVIVSAPTDRFGEVGALIERLDAPPNAEDTRLVTVPLKTARAAEVAQALESSLPASVRVRITPVPRSNALLLAGSNEAIDLVRAQIEQIDTEPTRALTAVRRFPLEHAVAYDAYLVLNRLLAGRPIQPGEPTPEVDWLVTENSIVVAATQSDMDEIQAMIAEIDRPVERDRRTEFVRLEFAEAEAVSAALGVFFGSAAREAVTPAERGVTIVPDPASNSLVISAAEMIWPRIQALITKLDTADYDTSRQLAVIPLTHADAESVARALNDGFRPTIEDRAREARAQRNQSNRREDDRRNEDNELPTVLVAKEGAPVVSAEPETNALIVFAGRRDLDRVREIVAQIDVPEFSRMAPPRIIPVRAGRAGEMGEALSAVFDRRGGDGRRTITIRGDNASSALIVRAPDDVFGEIVELAAALEAESSRAAPAPRVIRLGATRASRMRAIVLAATRPMADRLGEAIVVEADRAANALVVTASEGVMAEVERLVRELDGDSAPDAAAPEGGDEMRLAAGQAMRIVDLEHHAPDEMRALVTQLGVTRTPQGDEAGVVVEGVRVVSLTTRRAVSLLGAAGDVAAVEALVLALDREPSSSSQAVRLVPLRFATAEAVAQTLTRMLDPGTQSSATGPAAALAEQVRRLNMLSGDIDRRGLGVDLSRPVRLIPDPQTNSLLIASTPGNVDALREVAAMLDTLPIGDAVIVRIFPLEHAAATRVGQIIEELFQRGEALRRLPGTERRGLPSTTTGQALAGEIAVSVDDRTNALIIAGREDAVALVEVLVADLDSDRAARWVEPAIIALEFADAEELAQTLRRVLIEAIPSTPEAEALRRQVGRIRFALAGGEVEPGASSEADVFVPLTSLVITADASINAVLAIGSPANLTLVRELVSLLDVEAAGAGNQVRVYPLEHAGAERVAGLASEVFRQREDAGALRRQDRLTIAPDARTNAVIVSTSPRGFAIFETLVRTLDAPDTNFSVGLHVLPVTGADAGELAPRIQRLMDERLEASRRAGSVELPSDAFRIEADRANNLLIVAASDENLGVVRSLLDSMTTDEAVAAGADRTELITVRNGRAEEVADTINELYTERENARRGERSVSVVANDRLNAVLVSGTDGDIAAVRALIDDLENAQVAAVQDVRRIELKAANAIEVVNLIQTVLAGRPIDGRTGANAGQATRLRFFRRQLEDELEGGAPMGEAALDAAIRSQVRLTPDLRTNSVVVTAPPEVLALVEAIIEDLDSTTAGSRKIEIFELANADARAMSVVLRDLFNLQQQGDRFVLIPTQTSLEEGSEGLRLGETTLTPVPDERQELSITIDARTNTILVSGTAEYLDLVREVIDRLDNIEANERESLVYHLQNAKADEAELTLQSYFETEAQRIRELLGPDQAGSALRQLEQEVTVVGDAASNKLVVSASPRYVDTVTRIIEEIDAAPPQVMIQVLLAEVTLDDEDTWGADFEIGPLGGQAYQVATSAASGGVATAIGTPNLSVATADFSLLVRALEVQGKLEVLSRPQVTVNNNEPAFIQVGEDVAIVTGVERLDSGNTRSDVERRDVGIILNVTPSISNDGFVRMDISPEISSVTARTTQVSEDFEAPIISQRRIETTVTVQDGETVVIGGLIQTTEQERVSKVPLLGDIPVLGLPFRATERSRVKTELLVILTPTVIPGDSPDGLGAFRLRTQQAIDEMSQPGRIREAIRGRPSPELGRPDADGPAPTAESTPIWDDDDSLFPRGRDGVGGSP